MRKRDLYLMEETREGLNGRMVFKGGMNEKRNMK